MHQLTRATTEAIEDLVPIDERSIPSDWRPKSIQEAVNALALPDTPNLSLAKHEARKIIATENACAWEDISEQIEANITAEPN
jgi:hypothetical protein